MLTVKEMKEMDERYAEWEQRAEREGRMEGERLLLRKQLVWRFGPLPESLVARIQEADSATLERWGERILFVSTLDRVFAAPQSPSPGGAVAESKPRRPEPITSYWSLSEEDRLTIEETDMLLADLEQRLKDAARKEGEGRFLCKQIVRRFGPLPEGMVARIQQAESATLERWAERLLSASTLDEVFAA